MDTFVVAARNLTAFWAAFEAAKHSFPESCSQILWII